MTGNVLRDYLTDLFPIMELGTSAKMLSIVPLMNGGGLFETGAGGSAPKHVQQLVEENFLRWDSLGEFGLAASWSTWATPTTTRAPKCWPTPGPGHWQVPRHQQVAVAQSRWYRQPRQPLLPDPVLGQATAAQNDDAALQARFAPLAKTLTENEETIVAELNAVEGKPADIGGYYAPDAELTAKVMRPSQTLNSAIAAL